MASKKPTSADTGHRHKRRVYDRSRISLFDVFRESYLERDANTAMVMETSTDGSNTVARISGRSNARRLGVTEEVLRRHVHQHLQTLMNSIRLDATVDLDETPHVARSVLNYGFQDLSNLTRKELTSRTITDSIKQSLADHEPRLVKNSIGVKILTLEGDEYQRVAIHVAAELIADPADISIDFIADVDIGAGKVILNAQRI